MSRRRRILLLGLALVLLLVVGVGAALLWPLPSEAEKALARVHEGMTFRQAREMLLDETVSTGKVRFGGETWCGFEFPDGSYFSATLRPGRNEEWLLVLPPAEVTPPRPVHPLTRLRRTLAHAFPFLGE
jgi:hypothetical protein